jgi:hypothetical protein
VECVETRKVGIFPVQRLTAEVKLSAATCLAIVAALVFAGGLFGLYNTLYDLTHFRFVYSLEMLGLVGGPLLLVGSRIGYWFSLLVMTMNTIVGVASLTFVVWAFSYKFVSGESPSGIPGSVLIPILLTVLPISWLAVRVLRSPDVRSTFGL